MLIKHALIVTVIAAATLAGCKKADDATTPAAASPMAPATPNGTLAPSTPSSTPPADNAGSTTTSPGAASSGS